MSWGIFPLEDHRVSLGHYVLGENGDAMVGKPCALKNIHFRDGGAFVGGGYENHDVCTPVFGDLDRMSFGLEVEFHPAETKSQWAIIASRGYRWLGVGTSAEGHLRVTANNQEHEKVYNDVTVEPLSWHKVSLSVEFNKLLVHVYFDGVELDPWKLPEDFKLAADVNQFSTTNYSNGVAFHGLIRNLRIYGMPITRFKALTIIATAIDDGSVFVSCLGMAGDPVFESTYQSNVTFGVVRADLVEHSSTLNPDEAFKLLAPDGTELSDAMLVSAALPKN